MEERMFIPLTELCEIYQIDIVFFDTLVEYELVEIVEENQTKHLPLTAIDRFEQIVRLHRDLQVNLEGVDVILNLLNQLNSLEKEREILRNRLRFYED
ncbi:MAG: chaperone modulator CbpM [Putridiphycobacter sp.]|nr:chaperone modulator CbpM [Putridiphycobacter sp.]